ncbi:MAG: helix-turn-helix transcriptional regulator [Lachnospiraceae bacterium]|nr:helix-turn-helix transcriptional regulator [Lachnospiraceae bacterium]
MKEINFEQISKRIKETRTARGLTQEYLANAADVNVSHISNIENNRVKISLPTLVNICNALDVTVDYILASEYTTDATLDNEVIKRLHSCSDEQKNKILKIMDII